MAHKMQNGEKRRHISFLAYVPDDAVEWTADGYVVVDEDKVEREYDRVCAELDGQRVKCCISPLHNRDRYDERSVEKWKRNHVDKNGEMSEEDAARCPKVGDIKKPHWHIYYYSPGGRTIAGMRKLFKAVLSPATKFWVEDDGKTAIRYHAHLDSPSKEPYDPMGVRTFGGLDISCLWKADGMVKQSSLQAIMGFVKDNECTNYYDLANFVVAQDDPTLFDCVVSKYGFLANYMGGLAQKLAKADRMAKEGKA